MLKIVSIGNEDKNQLSRPASIPCKDWYLTYFLTLLATLLFTYTNIFLLEWRLSA